MRRKLSKKEIEKHYSWQEGDTTYEWYGNGMLKSIRLPNGKVVSFEYDALGRRTLKEFRGIRYRYAWDGNVLLHEWNYHSWTKPIRKKDKYGRYSYCSPEPLTNVTTWVYDGQSHTPVAKFTEEDCYSIVQDHLGTPTQAFDSRGNKVWDCVLDIYGEIQMIEGDRDFIPFRFQGQYADVETGLYYNRFRYYSPDFGNYISQDPIRMAGNNPTLYGYVKDTNSWLDPFGLDCKIKITDGDGITHDIVATISKSDFPETAQHIQDAIKNGHPDIVTISRLKATERRAESLKDIATKKGFDRDEWPMAIFKEGGKGASIRYISPSDNRGAGAAIMHALKGKSKDIRVLFKIID